MSSRDPHLQKEAIYRAYAEDAVYEDPFMSCRGIDNIIKAQNTWTSLVNDESQVKSILIE
jgi:hypothetical protein